jgi:hypothetical protein
VAGHQKSDGEGGEKAKKNRAGETERKKNRTPRKFEKKFVQRLFNRENYKLK